MYNDELLDFINENTDFEIKKEMKRMYIITRFDLKTDITMDYQLKSRSIVYSIDDLKLDIQYLLKEVYNEYKEITNTNIFYDDFYNKSDLIGM